LTSRDTGDLRGKPVAAPEPPHQQAAASPPGWNSDARSLNSLAFSATIHCLTGCGIGEILGLVIASALDWSVVPSIALALVLAFFFGYALTLWPLLTSGLPLTMALRTALAADTLSIVVMEIVDNAVILLVPGAMDAGIRDPHFWASLATALVVAFAFTYPVNRWLIARGMGHALVHSHHD
jgi:hypothetical protein